MAILKVCSNCKVPKKLDEFYNRYDGEFGEDHHCKLCNSKRGKKLYKRSSSLRDKIFFKSIKRNYGLSKQQYIAKLKTQNNKCSICQKDLLVRKDTQVDHCHKSGKVRDIICNKCNSIVGFFESTPNNVIEKIVWYIEYHKTTPTLLAKKTFKTLFD